MDSDMYLVMCYHWSTDPDKGRWDETMVAAMSVDSANRYVQNWVSPHGDYEPREELTKHDSHGRLWRFFQGTGDPNDCMTMRIDRVPLI